MKTLNWITPAKRDKFLADVKAVGFNVTVPVLRRWTLPGVVLLGPVLTRKDLIVRAHELQIKVVPGLRLLIANAICSLNFTKMGHLIKRSMSMTEASEHSF